MAKYFVTGATGFIGGRVTRQLVDAGHDVVAIARNPESARDPESIGVDVRRGDITNQESLRGRWQASMGCSTSRAGTRSGRGTRRRESGSTSRAVGTC